MTEDNEAQFLLDNLHGSAKFETLKVCQAAGLTEARGLYYGLFSPDGPDIRLAAPKSTLLCGNEGAGKKRDTVYEQVATCEFPVYVNDPSGRIAAVTICNQSSLGKYAYCFMDEPGRLNRAPWFLIAESINPLSELKPDTPLLAAKIDRIVECMVEADSPSLAAFSQELIKLAGQWFGTIIHGHILVRNQATSLPEIYSQLMLASRNGPAWDRILETHFSNSPLPSFRRLASEMRFYRSRQPEKYLRILHVLLTVLDFLEHPETAQKLGGNARPLSQILATNFTFYNLSQHRVLQRLFFIALLMAKQENQATRPMAFIIDQRAHLGKLEMADGKYIKNQAASSAIIELWDSLVQLKNGLGETGMQLKLSRSQIQQFYDVDAYTAGFVSKSLGVTTVKYKSSRAKMQDDQFNASIALALIEGKDPLGDIVRINAQKDTYDFQPRALRKPEEIEQMPLNRQIIFTKGFQCAPIYGARKSYLSKVKLIGKYLPDPGHPPYNRIEVVMADNKQRTLPVRITTVPAPMRQFPQYASGYKAEVVPPLTLHRVAEKSLRSLLRKSGFLT
ncbi:type IV secretory system conjugative DNA transfer family protein [Ketobacter sp.]|uniref:type IV secretory system conjugative DNA transfer family protein n=1 Tax=Ketobacter sp. TaxID=2083498 RepID=UPI000F2C1C61|nr:type IV secretory system conjugative DNA transfer family protein [Ketobacter sp.]RLU01742.1 MAG: hypothetical protein D9N14_00990 [Ketobacter sp.]